MGEAACPPYAWARADPETPCIRVAEALLRRHLWIVDGAGLSVPCVYPPVVRIICAAPADAVKGLPFDGDLGETPIASHCRCRPEYVWPSADAGSAPATPSIASFRLPGHNDRG